MPPTATACGAPSARLTATVAGSLATAIEAPAGSTTVITKVHSFSQRPVYAAPSEASSPRAASRCEGSVHGSGKGGHTSSETTKPKSASTYVLS